MNTTIELYPVWLRIWHWLNAILFLTLLVTGISLHFGGESWVVIPFARARTIHNMAGILFTANLLFFILGQITKGYWIHYRPQWRSLLVDLLRQAMFYGMGIFKGEPHPFPMTRTAKFNPLQQVTYLGVMLGLMPVLVGSGWLFLFPDLLPETLWGMTALLPVAVLHYLSGLFLTLFMLGHIYLATAGESWTSEFGKMIRGYRL
ncbi:MAG: cytochrome B [Magnetococcales bacterium]|nr:cytochrome B [Magnetococcales bacterium]